MLVRLQTIDTHPSNIVLPVDDIGNEVEGGIERAKSMSTLEKDGLEACLFSRQDRKLVNIKFMRGTDKVIEADDLCAAVTTLINQRNTGTPSGAAKSGKTPTDVRNLVAIL